MLKRSNLVQSILLPTAIAILIAAWLGSWVRWIIRATGRDVSSPVPSSLAIALVILSATFGTRYVNDERRAQLHPKALIVVAGFVAIFGAAWLTYGDRFLNSPEFFTLTRGVSVLVVLLIFAIISIWALRRLDRARKKELDETRENIATRQLLLDQLRALLARFRFRPATLPPQPYLGLNDPADDPRLIVRRTYQSILAWARSMGYARFPYQTPSTYAEALTAAMPESREPIAALTATYVRARYASEPIVPADARLAQAALIRLQTHNVIKSTLTNQA